MTTQAKTQTDGGWGFWGTWGLAFLGFPIGGLAGQALTGGVTTVTGALLGGVATGAVLGATQWLALSRRLPLSPSWWVAATAGGMAVGLAGGVAPPASTLRRASPSLAQPAPGPSS